MEQIVDYLDALPAPLLNAFTSLMVAAITFFVGKITVMVQNMRTAQVYAREEQDAIKACVTATARQKLISEHSRYMQQGYMDYDDRAAWGDLYASYEAMGKNGIIDRYREELRALPTRDPNSD